MRNAKHYTLIQYLGALFIASLVAIAIDLLTNRVDVTRYGWDYVHYISMAEKGIVGNTFISAPFAYRIVTPLAAHILITYFFLSTETAFLVLTYIGTISSLVLVFVLAKRFNANFGIAIFVMLMIGLSFYTVKYVMFDIYRPDPLAYPVILIAMLALFDKRYLLCILLSVFGVLIREFVVIPAAIVIVLWICEYYKNKLTKNLIQIVLLIVSVLLVFILPRMFITAHPSESLIGYIKTVLHPLRNINVLFSLISFLLPVLLLFTRPRFQQLWDELKKQEILGILVLYIIFTLLLTDIGGTDIPRFITFLFIPLAICLTIILKTHVDPLEIGFVLATLLIFNRIFWDIPFDSKENFRAFYGGISTQIDLWTLERTIEIIVYSIIAVRIRTFSFNRRLKVKTDN